MASLCKYQPSKDTNAGGDIVWKQLLAGDRRLSNIYL